MPIDPILAKGVAAILFAVLCRFGFLIHKRMSLQIDYLEMKLGEGDGTPEIDVLINGNKAKIERR